MSVGVVAFHLSLIFSASLGRGNGETRKGASTHDRNAQKDTPHRVKSTYEHQSSHAHSIPRISTATKLVNAGATSLSDLDLPFYNKLLSPSQKVSVKYRDHLTKPVSREAAEDITVRAYVPYHGTHL